NEIGPEPSPWSAKTKSARPEYRASVSRMRQSESTSIRPWESGTARRSQPPSPSRWTSSRQVSSRSPSSSGSISRRHHASRSRARARWWSSKKGQVRKVESGMDRPRLNADSTVPDSSSVIRAAGPLTPPAPSLPPHSRPPGERGLEKAKTNFFFCSLPPLPGEGSAVGEEGRGGEGPRRHG